MRRSPSAAEGGEVIHLPLYARALRLKHLTPSGLLCFVFLEGAIALGGLLALAELVSWWGVVILPVTVALMVKLNDVIAGFLSRPPAPARPVAARAPVAVRASVVVRASGAGASGAGASMGGASMGGASGAGASIGGASIGGASIGGASAAGASIGGSPGSGEPPPRVPLLGEESTTRLPGVIQPGVSIKRPWAERLEVQEQWARQSATRRYE